jgi:hypothetical protein
LGLVDMNDEEKEVRHNLLLCVDLLLNRPASTFRPSIRL